MQILFIADHNATTILNKEVTKYKRSLNRNILFVEDSDLYDKNGFIYAKAAISLKDNKVYSDVLLSPSLLVNLSSSSLQVKIDNYLKNFWINTNQVFFQIDNSSFNQNSTNIYELLRSNKSYCFAYMPDCANPSFTVLENSINISQDFAIGFEKEYLKGLLEFSMIENYSASHYIDQASNKELNKKSALFLVQFDIHPNFGDFTVDIKDIVSTGYETFINSNLEDTFIYFDSIIEQRAKVYASNLYFREKIFNEANKHDIEFEPSCKNFFLLIKDNDAGFQKAYFGGVNTAKGLAIANDKHKTNTHLKEHGFNVNQSNIYPLSMFDDVQSVNKLNLKYPAVLKPADKQGGYGVFTNLKTSEKLFDAMNILKDMNDVKHIIIEEFFSGLTYRFFVVDDETKAILKFEFPNVVGDGVNTINSLIQKKNKVAKSKIKISDVIKLSLADNNYSLETVLQKGEKLILSYDSHPSLGGGAVDVTNIVDNSYKELAVKVSKSMELDVSGVDLMINKKGDYKVIEVNTAPAMATHLEPQYGHPVNVYYEVMNTLLKRTKISGENSFFPELIYFHR